MKRMSAKDYLRSSVPGPKRSKYQVKTAMSDGIFFATTSEQRRYAELKIMEAAGEIADIRRQVPYVLAPGVKLTFRKKASPDLRYTADFVYRVIKTGEERVEDVKPQGMRDDQLEKDFVMRAHLMKAVHGLDVYVWRAPK